MPEARKDVCVCACVCVCVRACSKWAGIPYRNFFFPWMSHLHLLIHAILIYVLIFLMVYSCFDFKKYTGTSKFPFRALYIYIYMQFATYIVLCFTFSALKWLMRQVITLKEFSTKKFNICIVQISKEKTNSTKPSTELSGSTITVRGSAPDCTTLSSVLFLALFPTFTQAIYTDSSSKVVPGTEWIHAHTGPHHIQNSSLMCSNSHLSCVWVVKWLVCETFISVRYGDSKIEKRPMKLAFLLC
jgi:hypothetical protein